MIITDYASLQFNVADFLNRTDLTDAIPTFIQLAEAEMKRVVKTKHTNRSEIIVGSGASVINLPPNTTQVKSLYVTAPVQSGGPIVPTSPEKVYQHRSANQTAGRPVYAAIIDLEALISPLTDQEYTVEAVVEGPFVPLSDSNPTNWILDDYQDVYLYGSLVASAPYLKNDERVPMWSTLFTKGLQQLEGARLDNEWPNTPVQQVPTALGRGRQV